MVFGLLVGVAALATAPPPVVIGHSAQGRPIVARRIGDPASPRKVLLVGAIHGDEGAGRAVVRSLAARGAAASTSDVWLVSTINPDGSRHATRGNAHRVDLNATSPGWRSSASGRLDYSGPRPFSEPGSRAVRRLVLRLRPQVTI